MREWLRRFYYDKKATLTIKGETYQFSDWERIGGGSEKHVYKIKGKNFCFFIPHKYFSEADWNFKIELEKNILDEMTLVGLKTQQFELVDLEINSPEQPSYTIKALLTKDFQTLCQDESLVIYNPKGDEKVCGKAPDFMALRARFKEEAYVQEMFQKIIKEYATAYTFSLPITAIQSTDDSEHICFELSSPVPTVRYMFWDVVADTNAFPFIPLVPSLSELRKGPRSYSNRENYSLYCLANTVACSILEILYSLKSRIPANSFTFVGELQEDILKAIDHSALLKEALEHARTQAVNYLHHLSNKINLANVGNKNFTKLLTSAISTNNLELVQRYYEARPMEQLTEGLIDTILDASNRCGNSNISQFLHSKLGPEKGAFVEERRKIEVQEKVGQLKNTFFSQYNKQLSADKGAWCGLYSLFAKSHVKSEADLHELVKHAQGLSKEGSGKRSQLVMKQLGWLDKNNQVRSDLASVLKEENTLTIP
ncbi:hypothetical protein [Legionella jamestowniensis]|uniref:Uncharacterized protein n=1 Tax=Legionella jamestowniensis TaxID=455 RepID=A0A0W0UKW0_9GAMM|nr:hypothetical protein [Legionella jamestowniensis]KTD08546.1 hypothetical protein Ljam_2741 [Legionella jamestowniensis]SFL52654.1 hypothetical protein SAMN02746073_0684 [Legionella jamestowniensis DSM 19215]